MSTSPGPDGSARSTSRQRPARSPLSFLWGRGRHVWFWLDEGIAAGIASHPLADIAGQLRQDGSPPVLRPVHLSARRKYLLSTLAIFEWIECWYNPHRRHSYCSMLSPVEFENAHAERARAAA
jgi:transposase InsO family protein